MVDRRRQWRAENQEIAIKKSVGRGKYLVSGSRDRDYEVDYRIPFCECPDWQKREPNGGCKHILYVKLREGIIDPLPSAYTNFGNPENRMEPDYSDQPKLSKRTKKRDNWKCQKCGRKGGQFGPAELHAHHIVSKKKGGKDSVNNLIAVCRSCHEDEHGHSIPSTKKSYSHGGATHSTNSESHGDATQSTNSEKSVSWDGNVWVSPEENLSRPIPGNSGRKKTDPSEDIVGSTDTTAESNITELTDLSGIGDTRAEKLRAEGFARIEDVRTASESELTSVEGIGQELAVRICSEVSKIEYQESGEDKKSVSKSNAKQTGGNTYQWLDGKELSEIRRFVKDNDNWFESAGYNSEADISASSQHELTHAEGKKNDHTGSITDQIPDIENVSIPLFSSKHTVGAYLMASILLGVTWGLLLVALGPLEWVQLRQGELSTALLFGLREFGFFILAISIAVGITHALVFRPLVSEASEESPTSNAGLLFGLGAIGIGILWLGQLFNIAGNQIGGYSLGSIYLSVVYIFVILVFLSSLSKTYHNNAVVPNEYKHNWVRAKQKYDQIRNTYVSHKSEEVESVDLEIDIDQYEPSADTNPAATLENLTELQSIIEVKFHLQEIESQLNTVDTLIAEGDYREMLNLLVRSEMKLEELTKVSALDNKAKVQDAITDAENTGRSAVNSLAEHLETELDSIATDLSQAEEHLEAGRLDATRAILEDIEQQRPILHVGIIFAERYDRSVIGERIKNLDERIADLSDAIKKHEN